MARQGWKALIIVAILGVCSLTTVSAQGATFADPQGRFTFTVPSGWQQGPPPQNTNLPQGTVIAGIFNAAAPLNGNFNVVTVGLPAGVDLDQIVTQSRAGIAQSLPGYEEGPGGVQNLTLGGQPARRYDYFVTPPQASKLRAAQIVALQGNTLFVLTFTAAENDFNTFFQQATTALNSFTYTGRGGATPTALPSTGMPTATRWQGEREALIVMIGSALIAAGSLLRRRYARV